MSTREFLQRRYRTGADASRHGIVPRATAGDSRARGHARAGHRAGHRGKRGHHGTKQTTGYRQPTIGPGYADLFPGTGGSPIKYDCSYYKPCYHGYRRCYYGFYYDRPVAYAYVPYGFYGGGTSIYIDAGDAVAADYPVERYEEQAPPQNGEASYEAPAGSAAAERYMREATELFRKAEYPEAARRFRLAAIASPDSPGPLFAMGQALIALENYPYAAKVIRQAVDLDAALLREGGDLAAVFRNREEFERVQAQLKQRTKDRPDDLHAVFLLGVVRYFSGDPAARGTFRELAEASANDRIVHAFSKAAEERFKKADELPPID